MVCLLLAATPCWAASPIYRWAHEDGRASLRVGSRPRCAMGAFRHVRAQPREPIDPPIRMDPHPALADEPAQRHAAEPGGGDAGLPLARSGLRSFAGGDAAVAARQDSFQSRSLVCGIGDEGAKVAQMGHPRPWRPAATAGVALARLLAHAPDADARKLQTSGTWAMRNGQVFIPLQFAMIPMGSGAPHTSMGDLSKGRGFLNGPIPGAGGVVATGSAPATLVVPQHRFRTSPSAAVPFSFSTVQIATMLGLSTTGTSQTFRLPPLGVSAMGMPFGQVTSEYGFAHTTGTVIVQKTAGSGNDDFFTVMGSDARTPLGAGNISTVAGGIAFRDTYTRQTPYASFHKIWMTLGPPVPSLSPAGVAAAGALMLLAVGYARQR